MNKCPVCEAELKSSKDICSVCDTDLSVVHEMGRLPASLKQFAADAASRDENTQAVTYYRLALEMKPQDEHLLRGLAKSLGKAGDSKEAIAIWRKLLDILPEDLEALEQIAASETASTIPAPWKTGTMRIYAPILMIALFLGWFGHEYTGKYLKERPETATIRGLAVSPDQSFVRKNDIQEDTPYPVVPDETSDSFQSQNDQSHPPTRFPAATKPHLSASKTDTDRPAQPSAPTPTAGSLSLKMEVLVRKLSAELPHGIKVTSKNGGLFLEGKVSYLWGKKAVEDRVRISECSFVDMTGVTVEHPNAFRYQVRQGDSLYSLSKIFLGRSALWPIFYESNRDVLTNPDKLSVGQAIVVYTQIP